MVKTSENNSERISMVKNRMYLFYTWRWELDIYKIMVSSFAVFEGLPLTRIPVRITRIEFIIENGISSTRNVEYANIRAHPGKIEDLKFVDDEKLMLAISQKGKIL